MQYFLQQGLYHLLQLQKLLTDLLSKFCSLQLEFLENEQNNHALNERRKAQGLEKIPM